MEGTPSANPKLKLFDTNTPTSSPLSDINDLNQSFLSGNTSPQELSETIPNNTTAENSEQESDNEQNDGKLNSKGLQERLVQLSRPKAGESSKRSGKKLDQRSETSEELSKGNFWLRDRKSRRESDSGSVHGMGNAEQEEGVLLPGRKRPIPFSSLNNKDRSGRTLIFKYAARGDIVTTEILLKAGASLRVSDYAGWTPLHEACLEGQFEIVKLMLAYDPDVNARGGDGDTPLHDAIGNTHLNVVEILLRYGASMEKVNEHNQTPLEFAESKLKEIEKEGDENSDELKDIKLIIKKLQTWKEMSKRVVKRDESGQTMLHHAATKGDARRCLKILEYGADINAADNSNWTPLHNAAIAGHEEVMELLLRYGADVDAAGLENETPLHDAVSNKHYGCTCLLLQYGAEPFRKNSKGKMPKDCIPDNDAELNRIFNLPMENWEPHKRAEFYPRVLLEPSEEYSQKADTTKISKVDKKKSFAWGGLDDRDGPFESSREEKKFKALWSKIAKNTEHSDSDLGASTVDNSVKGERPKEKGKGTQELKKSSSKNSLFENVSAESRKRKSIEKIDHDAKRIKEKNKNLNEPKSLIKETKEKISNISIIKPVDATTDTKPVPESNKLLTEAVSNEESYTVKGWARERTPSEISLQKEKRNEEPRKKKKRFTISGYQRASQSKTLLSAEDSVETSTAEVESKPVEQIEQSHGVEPMPDLPETPVTKNVVLPDESAVAEMGQKSSIDEVYAKEVETESPFQLEPNISFEEENELLDVENLYSETEYVHLKKRALLNLVNRENDQLSEKTKLPSANYKRRTFIQRKKLAEEILSESSSEESLPPTPTMLHPKKKHSSYEFSKPVSTATDDVFKEEARVEYCIPLCGFDIDSEPFVPAKTDWLERTCIYGKKIISGHSKVFLDLQLAYCFGFNSGREFLENYPNLKSRVASRLEKEAFEKTIVGKSLLVTMRRKIDPYWIQTIENDGVVIPNLHDIDIHLVYWTPELYDLITDIVKRIEAEYSLKLDWVIDVDWPKPDEPVLQTESTNHSYVHKFKRFGNE